jgi:hypothetical protein
MSKDTLHLIAAVIQDTVVAAIKLGYDDTRVPDSALDILSIYEQIPLQQLSPDKYQLLMDAARRIEKIKIDSQYEFLGEALNSGNGTYKP